MWSTNTAPNGFLLCDGAAVSRTTYAALFAIVGTTFGAGDNSTTFNVPNYTNRVPYGATLGATGGSADAVVVSHTHTATSSVVDPGHAHTIVDGEVNTRTNPYFNWTGTGGASVGVTGARTNSNTTGITVSTSNSTEGVSGTNANLPPYLGIKFIIKT
jgi:microcystin-dependent protein